jgi:hypothetical protein
MLAVGVALLGAARVEAAPIHVVVVEPADGASLAFPRTPYDADSAPQRIRLRSDGGPIGFEDTEIVFDSFAIVASGGDLEPGHEKFYDVVCRPSFPGRVASADVEIALCSDSCGADDDIALEIALSCPTGLVETPQSVVTLPSAYAWAPSQQVVSFTNPGASPVTITALRSKSAAFSARPETGQLPRTLAPGAALDVVVRFETDGLSGTGAALTGQIDVVADTVVAGRVNVKGTVLSALEPLELDRGVVPERAVYTIPFAVRNSYPSARTITAATSDRDDYRVLGLVGITLAPGEIAHGLVSVTGNLTFRIASINVAFNVGQSETARFAYEGVGPLISIVTPDDTPDDGRLDVGVHRTGGAAIERTITITNGDRDPIHALGCIAPEPPFELVGSCPLEIPSGGSADFTVRFTPQAAGDFVSQVGLQLGGGSQLFAMLSARVLESPLVSVAETLDLGTVAVGATGEAMLEIHNRDLAHRVAIERLIVDGAAFATALPADPTLAPGATIYIPVRFAPTVAGSATASLAIVLVGEPTPEAIVALTGVGKAAEDLPPPPSQPPPSSGCAVGAPGWLGVAMLAALTAVGRRRRRVR